MGAEVEAAEEVEGGGAAEELLTEGLMGELLVNFKSASTSGLCCNPDGSKTLLTWSL